MFLNSVTVVPTSSYVHSASPYMNNYMNFNDIEGVYTYTFEVEKKVKVILPILYIYLKYKLIWLEKIFHGIVTPLRFLRLRVHLWKLNAVKVH